MYCYTIERLNPDSSESFRNQLIQQNCCTSHGEHNSEADRLHNNTVFTIGRTPLLVKPILLP